MTRRSHDKLTERYDWPRGGSKCNGKRRSSLLTLPASVSSRIRKNSDAVPSGNEIRKTLKLGRQAAEFLRDSATDGTDGPGDPSYGRTERLLALRACVRRRTPRQSSVSKN